MDVGKPVEPPKPDPTKVVERLWHDYHRMEIGQSVTDGEMIKKLRHSFYMGAFCAMELTKKATQLPDRAMANLLMGMSNECKSVVKPLPNGQIIT